MISEQINKVKTDWKELLLKIDHENINDFFETNDKIYLPKKENIFQAFNLFNINETKLVFIFQDPYINYCKKSGLEQAHGIALSVRKGIKLPPSLRNFYKELENDIGISKIVSGDLTEFSRKNKILMINASLTVQEYKSNSHKKIWKKYTDELIKEINNRCNNLIFVLLGNFAKKKCKKVDESKHQIIKGVHPSPLSASRGFFGSKIFTRINLMLKEMDKEEIDYKMLTNNI